MLISIVIAILVFQGVKALKIGEILTPVVVFNKTPDGNKEAPTKLIGSGTLELKNYGNEGLWVHWVRGAKRPLDIIWKLNRRNYEERHKYFFYFRVRANEKQIISITLVDNSGLFTQDQREVGPQTNRIIISLAQEKFNKYYIPKEINGEWESKEVFDKKLNWGRIEKVELSVYDGNKIENTIVFEKILLLILT